MASPPVPISSLIVEDWFHGLYTAGMFLTVWMILTNTSYNAARKAALSGIVLGMYTCSTMHSALQWLYYSRAIDENELPDGPGLLFSLTHLAPWIEATGDTFFCLNILIADILFIWRCWVVWQKRLAIVILPMVMATCGIAMAARFIVAQVTLETSGDAFTSIKRMQDFVSFSTAYFVLSIATSLSTTFLLALRIVMVQRAAVKATGHRKNPFSAAIEIPVESAALYSLTLLIFVILNVTKNVNAFYAQNIHAQMTGIAPMLIVLRVAAGHSRPDTAWSTRPDPSIHAHTRSVNENQNGIMSRIRFHRPTNTTSTSEVEDGIGGDTDRMKGIVHIGKGAPSDAELTKETA
ncbi:hypothetical protein Moror_2366 [Moniliophthora roreri MCA 2997]|uniref:Uncharacterized protein n=2 Tax=Moniliophthora roreri TaxID=221103 RepID=V2WW78_MONRO|nr:hypothetical protein Moror_2366 [Moniliophthora roreri MCA 2997]KAI3600421.1 hypothetical protein WG66_001751 [Moniliophthora roreri]